MRDSTLWIDITELFGEFQWSEHPTGISRVILNFADHLRASPPPAFDRVIPLFWDPVAGAPVTLGDWSRLEDLSRFFIGLRHAYRAAGLERPFLQSGLRKGLITGLPRSFRYRLFPHLAGVPQFLRWARGQNLAVRPVSFGARDMLFVPGSFWLGGYAPRLASSARSAGTSVAAFVHDVLLLSHPQWLPGRHGAQFRRGAEAFLPQCSLLICNSQNTRDELQAHVSLPPRMSFALCRLADRLDAEPVPPPASDLAGQTFALVVSSVNPRKNHVLAVRAWRLLHRTLQDRTPHLVLVGGGHPDAQLAEALQHDAAEGRLVSRLTNVTDEQLAWLYRNAWLTLYPSLGEGYGLPVAEALALGKVCIASQAGGVAEIAPHLVDVVDLHDPATLADLVRAYFMAPERLAAREAAIRSSYRSTGWRDCTAVVGGLLADAAVRGRKRDAGSDI